MALPALLGAVKKVSAVPVDNAGEKAVLKTALGAAAKLVQAGLLRFHTLRRLVELFRTLADRAAAACQTQAYAPAYAQAKANAAQRQANSAPGNS